MSYSPLSAREGDHEVSTTEAWDAETDGLLTSYVMGFGIEEDIEAELGIDAGNRGFTRNPNLSGEQFTLPDNMSTT